LHIAQYFDLFSFWIFTRKFKQYSNAHLCMCAISCQDYGRSVHFDHWPSTIHGVLPKTAVTFSRLLLTTRHNHTKTTTT